MILSLIIEEIPLVPPFEKKGGHQLRKVVQSKKLFTHTAE